MNAMKKTITVSYLGYDDYRFIAGNASTFRIVLQKSAATMLDETVVIGYGKTTKKEVTGSVTSLKSADFDLGSYTDATAMLQGKVAGLTIGTVVKRITLYNELISNVI